MSLDLADIRAQLEQDFAWRWDEMRILKNQLNNIGKEDDQKHYRKALVVMLYAHYEGFCKTALTIYVGAINSENLKCIDVTGSIAAASLSDIFKDYENPTRKSSLFKNILPDDTQLHRFARQVDFITAMDEIWDRTVSISEDVVDVEDNLKPAVLKKIMYRLGFADNVFDSHEGDIHQLLNYRNRVAHGSDITGLNEADYTKVERAALRISNSLMQLITQSLRHGTYRRNNTNS